MTLLRANGSTTGADILIKRRDENGFLVEQIRPNEEKQQRLRLQKKEEDEQEDEEEQKPVIDAGLKSLDHCTCDARPFPPSVFQHSNPLAPSIANFAPTPLRHFSQLQWNTSNARARRGGAPIRRVCHMTDGYRILFLPLLTRPRFPSRERVEYCVRMRRELMNLPDDP